MESYKTFHKRGNVRLKKVKYISQDHVATRPGVQFLTQLCLAYVVLPMIVLLVHKYHHSHL